MRRIRIDISLGIAAVSLIGLANTAVAKDNDPPRFKTEVQLQVTHDGRGDTRDIAAERLMFDRTQRNTDDSRPQPSDMIAKPTPQMKTEILMRANGERDRGSEAEAARPGLDASRPMDQKEAKPVIEKKPEMPKMKTEIMLKVSGERGTDEASSGTNASTSAKASAASTKAVKPSLTSLPIMNEVKLRAGHGGGDNMQGETDER